MKRRALRLLDRLRDDTRVTERLTLEQTGRLTRIEANTTSPDSRAASPALRTASTGPPSPSLPSSRQRIGAGIGAPR